MPDSSVPINAPTSVGQSMASFEDATNLEHEKVIVEFIDGGGQPSKTSAANPFPVTDAAAEAALASIAAEDFATQATLAALLAKVITAPSTEAKQDAMIALLTTIAAITQPLTDTQLRATPVPISGTVAVTGGGDATAANQVTGNNSLASILAKIITAPSTEAKQDTIITALATLLTISDFDTKTGSLTETAPATDTASSGLNGRLQRIAQRLTTIIAGIPTTIVDGGNVTQGAVADAAWVSGNGTVISLLKKIASAGGGAVSIADGADVTLGALADAIVAAGATGSISAKLRRATQGLEDLKTLIVLATGSNIIGRVGIDQTTPGTTNLIALTAETTKAIGVVRNSDGAGNLLTSNSTTFSAKFGLDANLLGTLGTAFSTAGKVDIKSTQSFTDSTVQVLAVTALQSLASSATVGWQSLLVKNHVTKYNDFKIWVKLTTANTAPANDKAMYVFIIPWYTSDNGTTWNPSSIGTVTLPTGTDAAMTIASPHNLRLLGVLNYTTAQAVVQDSFLLSNCFGNRMPDGWSGGIINFSGAALSTGCVFDYTGINDILV